MQLNRENYQNHYTVQFDIGESFKVDEKLVTTTNRLTRSCCDCFFYKRLCSTIDCDANQRSDSEDVIFIIDANLAVSATLVNDTNSVNAGNEQTEVVAQKKEVPFY